MHSPYMKAARSYGIPAALEVSQSGRGAHVWIFFAHAISASVARTVATSLLGEAFRLRGSMHLSSYDRLFPSQDVHTGRGVGNLIAAPMNGILSQPEKLTQTRVVGTQRVQLARETLYAANGYFSLSITLFGGRYYSRQRWPSAFAAVDTFITRWRSRLRTGVNW